MIDIRVKNIEALSNGIHINPEYGDTFEEQLMNCYHQLDQIISNHRHIVMIAYFINASDNDVYINLYNKISAGHSKKYKSPFSIIAQPPVNNAMINLEIHHCSNELTPEFKKFENLTYCTFNQNDNKYIIAGGLQLMLNKTDIPRQSMESFRLMKGILEQEHMKFSHVFRQWNYIESIVDSSLGSQHYQIFNDVRSLFYDEANFIKGYPAATGIGMKTGGTIIAFLATTNNNIWPIKNPVQVDAHNYSTKVLAENKLAIKVRKTAPKFERAKAISIDNRILIYLSGTAAIKGEISLAQDDAFEQTLLTIDNITCLVGEKNLINYDIPVQVNSVIEPVSFRIYIKSLSDLREVKRAFQNRFGDFRNVIYLIADVCRPELLVEIEGVYRIKC